MLGLIKKFFAKKQIPEETIQLDELITWLDTKSKPLFENLNNDIDKIINKVKDEKEKVVENLKTLESAQLQNPKIPERAITIMQGNRAGFIKKVSYFFNKIDLEYGNYKELINKCNNITNEIQLLGKSTVKSYQVLNEFFAREAENIAINIKKIETYSKDILKSIENNKISDIDKIKNNFSGIKNKIKLKQQYSAELENNKTNLQNNKNKKSETENKINEIKSGNDYDSYKKLLEGKNNTGIKLKEIENRFFHDFSVLEKALKKYAKIAFENEKLILEYLRDSIAALAKDTDFQILKILHDLKNAIERDEFELDEKKKKKAIAKINELDGVYFAKTKDDYLDTKKQLSDIDTEIENNSSKKDLDSLNSDLTTINQDIENINNKISNISNEFEKINIEKLKENLQNEVSDVLNSRVTIL